MKSFNTKFLFLIAGILLIVPVTSTSQQMDTFNLTGPSSGGNSKLHPTFIWSFTDKHCDGVIVYGYMITVWKGNPPISTVWSTTVFSVVCGIDSIPCGIILDPATWYTWQVAVDLSTAPYYCSSTSTFKTLAPPTPPILIAPADSTTRIVSPDVNLGKDTMTFVWNKSVGAVKYVVLIDTNLASLHSISTNSIYAPFPFPIDFINWEIPPIIDTIIKVSNNFKDHIYYWTVCAWDSIGWSNIGNIRTFTLTNLPYICDALIPVPESTIIANSPTDTITFKWRNDCPPQSKIIKYWIRVDTDSALVWSSGQCQINDSTLIDTFTTRQLSSNCSYWWMVRAENKVGWGASLHGLVRHFTIITPTSVSKPVSYSKISNRIFHNSVKKYDMLGRLINDPVSKNGIYIWKEAGKLEKSVMCNSKTNEAKK